MLKAQPFGSDFVLATVTLTIVNSLPGDHFRLETSCYPGEASDPCHWAGGRGWDRSVVCPTPANCVPFWAHSRDPGGYLGDPWVRSGT